MELALYDPALGYYARAAQRSGRAGDFFTSVDVGPLFGELLAAQLAEMATILQATAEPHTRRATSLSHSAVPLRSRRGRRRQRPARRQTSSGRVRDRASRAVYARSPASGRSERRGARGAARRHSAIVRDRLSSASDLLPESFEGVLVANELLDALPVHQVVMREDGLKEVYVRRRRGWPVATGVPSKVRLRRRRLQDYLDRLGVTLEPAGASRSTCARSTGSATRRGDCARGFIILIDYGHEARELYSAIASRTGR